MFPELQMSWVLLLVGGLQVPLVPLSLLLYLGPLGVLGDPIMREYNPSFGLLTKIRVFCELCSAIGCPLHVSRLSMYHNPWAAPIVTRTCPWGPRISL